MKRLIMRAATTVALLGALVAPAALSGPAAAVPDTGAGGDTPGTSATVTTARTISVGGTIGYRVTGFPAGEVVYIKIDDGRFCSSSATHGACVVHQQRLDVDGAASGSFALPSDVAVGKHWLRFLASQEVAGSGGGVKGYTARGNTDFTVTAATSSGTSGKASDAATTGITSTATPAGETANGPTGGDTTAARGTVPSAGATLHVGPPKPVATVTVTVTPSPPADTSVDPRADDLAAVSATKSGRPPYAGISGLIVLVALAALLIARRVRRAGD